MWLLQGKEAHGDQNLFSKNCKIVKIGKEWEVGVLIKNDQPRYKFNWWEKGRMVPLGEFLKYRFFCLFEKRKKRRSFRQLEQV